MKIILERNILLSFCYRLRPSAALHSKTYHHEYIWYCTDGVIRQLVPFISDIGRLHRLRVLDVINNQLRRLPEEIVNLQRLQRLLVDRNLLQWLPTQLVTMETLEELSATGNDLLCLPMGKIYEIFLIKWGGGKSMFWP